MTGARLNQHARVTRLLWNVSIATGTSTVSMIVMLNGGIGVTRTGPTPPVVATAVLVVLSTLPLVIRDRFPIAVFIATAGATAIMAAAVFPIGLPLGPGIALYTIAVRRRMPRPISRRIIVVLLVTGFAAYLVAATVYLSQLPWTEALHGALLWAVLWFAGERTRLQRQQIDDLTRGALRERHLAAAEERTRIARDLHDSVGHAINVIATRAGAARLRHGENPDRSLAALETIEQLARQTAADIDHFVGALRTDTENDSLTAPRSLSSVVSLVDVHAGAGLHVTVETNGTARPLNPGVDQAAYRIVQEALTNASRHGRSTARLVLGYTDRGLDIEVTNPTSHAAEPVPGHGLLGATERAIQVGGALTTELNDGVFVLRASLPDVRESMGTT